VAACKFTRYNGKTTEKDKLRVAREAKLQQHLSHPNIVRLIAFREILPDSDDAKKYIEGGYFLMEYLEAGELFDKIGVSSVLTPSTLAHRSSLSYGCGTPS
jgi:serine/threonine protein kinase